MAKTYRELEAKNRKYGVVIYLLLASILVAFVLIAIINDQICSDFTAYENRISELESKNKVLDDELYDIKSSGTCLQRVPAFEK